MATALEPNQINTPSIEENITPVASPKKSFADATRTSTNQEKNEKEYDHLKEMSKREGKTFIFYDLGTANDITELVIRTLAHHFKKEPHELIHRISRNTRFRSRYEVTFIHEKDFSHLFDHGIVINGIRVKGYYSRDRPSREPSKPIVKFFAPNLPTFMDRRDIFELFKDEKICVAFERKDKRYNIPTGFWNLGFLDKEDKDFTLTYKGQDYKILSISKMAEKKSTRGQTQPATDNSKTAKEPTKTPKTNYSIENRCLDK